jgi:hypothetical protein
MFNKMMSKAKESIPDVSCDSVKNVINETVTDSKNGTNSILDKYWPIVEELLLDKLLTVAGDSLNNDEALEQVFSTAYELIPTPVRLVLPRDTFIQFCMCKKEPLLKKLEEYKSSNKTPTKKETVISMEPAIDNLYCELLPELLALCIVADGLIEKGEIQLATEIITHDTILEDKEKALNELATHVGSLIMQKSTAQSVFKLKSMDVFSKISKITNENEKERIKIIVEGMVEVANEELISHTKEVTDAILKRVVV